MGIDKTVVKLLEDICTAFPEIRPLMDNHEDFMTSAKMEAFAASLGWTRRAPLGP